MMPGSAVVMLPVEFSSSGSIVQGYFFPSVTKSAIATVIFLQGFPGIEGDELLCGRLATESVNVLTFNYRGTFRSEGHFSFSNAVADIGAALRFIWEQRRLESYQVYTDEIVLGGWSFGGALVPAGAVQHPEFSKIFMVSGRNFGKEARKIEREPAYAKQVRDNLQSLRAPIGPVNFRDDLISNLIDNQASFDHEILAPLLKGRDILLIGGWDDSIVPIEAHTIPFYRSLVEHGAHSVRIEAFQDEHEFSESKDRLIQLILNWLMEE